VAQLASVGSAWDARLRRIKAIAEAIERSRAN
jgi:ArsR family transcriptional regulator, cadmium/lead-responsive transcriptional repressor